MDLLDKIQPPSIKNKSNDLKYIPKPFKRVAKNLETEFLQFLLKKMEGTVHLNKKDSTAKDYYKSLLNLERAKTMSNNQEGLGIQKLILDQIYPSRLRSKIAFNHYKKQNQKDASIKMAKDINRPIFLKMESDDVKH